MALACSPRLLIADEPTTALDVTIQAGILDLIRDLQESAGTAVIFITHDMGVVAEIADRVVVMRHGRMVETAETRTLFAAPKADYTSELLDAVPKLGSGAPVYAAPETRPDTGGESHAVAVGGEAILDVRNLVTRFPVRGGLFRQLVARVHAVENVSFSLRAGETLGLVGESGSGKSTIGRSLLKLVKPDSGEILFGGKDLVRLDSRRMRPFRRDLQMIFQDPYASLNPRMSIADTVTEPLYLHSSLSAARRREIAVELLARVRLPADSIDRYPHQFSGGQRQRICIARALSSRPRIIIADEAVSALDVSVQAEVLDLMQELQQEDGIGYIFISHDIAVVEKVSHRVAVLDQGRIVEIGQTDAVLGNPQHAYTRQLLEAVPVADPERRRQRSAMEQVERKSPIRPLDYRPQPLSYFAAGPDHMVLS
jgi:ABC-type glutathione transport system ATPase component